MDPPPTDGPNTRFRRENGLPPISGSKLPLPGADAGADESAKEGGGGYPTPVVEGGGEWSAWDGYTHTTSQGGEQYYSYPTTSYEGLQSDGSEFAQQQSYPPFDSSHSYDHTSHYPSSSSSSEYYTPSITTYSHHVQTQSFAPPNQHRSHSHSQSQRLVSTTETIIDHGEELEEEQEEEEEEEMELPSLQMTKEEWLRMGGFSPSQTSAEVEGEAQLELPRSSYPTYESQQASYEYSQPSYPPSSASHSFPDPSTQNFALPSLPSPAPSPSSPQKQQRKRAAPSPSSRSQTRSSNRPSPYPLPSHAHQPAPLPPPLQAPPSFTLAPHPSSSSSRSHAAATTLLSSLPPQIPSSQKPKKPHTRRTSVSHIPRPRNAFILFRSHCVASHGKSFKEEGLKDHKNLSRIIAEIWRGLGKDEKEVWEKAAEVEKEEHGRRWPGYKYQPKVKKGAGGRGKKKVVEEEEEEDGEEDIEVEEERSPVVTRKKKFVVKKEEEDLEVTPMDDFEEEEESENEDEDYTPVSTTTRSGRKTRQASPPKRSQSSPKKLKSTTPTFTSTPSVLATGLSSRKLENGMKTFALPPLPPSITSSPTRPQPRPQISHSGSPSQSQSNSPSYPSSTTRTSKAGNGAGGEETALTKERCQEIAAGLLEGGMGEKLRDVVGAGQGQGQGQFSPSSSQQYFSLVPHHQQFSPSLQQQFSPIQQQHFSPIPQQHFSPLPQQHFSPNAHQQSFSPLQHQFSPVPYPPHPTFSPPTSSPHASTFPPTSSNPSTPTKPFKHSRLARRTSGGSPSSPTTPDGRLRMSTGSVDSSPGTVSGSPLGRSANGGRMEDKRIGYGALSAGGGQPWFAPSSSTAPFAAGMSGTFAPSTTTSHSTELEPTRQFSPTKFDNSPLFGSPSSSRKFSLGRWEIRKASGIERRGMSEREVRAESFEEERGGEGDEGGVGMGKELLEEFYNWGGEEDGCKEKEEDGAFHCGTVGLFGMPQEVFGGSGTGLGIDFVGED